MRADDFKKYLASGRSYEAIRPNPAPFADEYRDELSLHLSTVVEWINSDGAVNRKAMAEAMRFFGTRYRASGKIYRGTAYLVFDGKPASYTKRLDIAEGFAVAGAESGRNFFVIERKAASNSLDLAKLLKQYANCDLKRCDEAEVIAFNTPVPERSIMEYVR